MSDEYYLKPFISKKVETYTYEYDNIRDYSCGGDRKYYVDIVFENDKFSRIDFGGNNRKSFDDNLRTKELGLLNKIQEEIKRIEKNHLK
jgi:hypothetical protein